MSNIFKGFKTYKPPCYTVTCPQSGYQFEVRSLNVGEMTRIKESLITQNRITENMLDIIWDAIVHSPEHITNKEDLAKYTTTNDRNAIVYGIYSATFGSAKEYEMTCGFCGNVSNANIDYSKFFNMELFPAAETVIESYKVAKAEDTSIEDPELEKTEEDNLIYKTLSRYVGPVPKVGHPEGIARSEVEFEKFFEFIDSVSKDLKLTYGTILQEYEKINNVKSNVNVETLTVTDPTALLDPNNIFNKIVKVVLPVSKIVVYIKAPTIKDERELLNKLTMNTDVQLSVSTDILFISHMEEYEEGGTIPIQTIDVKSDLLIAYKMLPPTDREFLIDRYEEEFGKYDISLKVKWDCQNRDCGERNELEVDIVSQFFRTITFSR